MPLLIAPPPPSWERFIPPGTAAPAAGFNAGLPVSADGWAFPVALLRPLASLFGAVEPAGPEDFLSGLQAEKLLGAQVLPAVGKRHIPLAWVGVALRVGGRHLFADLRGGCWVPGFPAIGRDREFLRAAGISDHTTLGRVLGEVGAGDALGPALYFNFHHEQSAAGGKRVYILDSASRRLHGFARPAGGVSVWNF